MNHFLYLSRQNDLSISDIKFIKRTYKKFYPDLYKIYEHLRIWGTFLSRKDLYSLKDINKKTDFCLCCREEKPISYFEINKRIKKFLSIQELQRIKYYEPRYYILAEHSTPYDEICSDCYGIKENFTLLNKVKRCSVCGEYKKFDPLNDYEFKGKFYCQSIFCQIFKRYIKNYINITYLKKYSTITKRFQIKREHIKKVKIFLKRNKMKEIPRPKISDVHEYEAQTITGSNIRRLLIETICQTLEGKITISKANSIARLGEQTIESLKVDILHHKYVTEGDSETKQVDYVIDI